MKFSTGRRDALFRLGAGMAAGLAQGTAAQAAGGPSLAPAGAASLQDLSQTLAGLPRRRDFRTRPMIADHPDLWDAAALDAVLAYSAGPRQAFDNTDLTGPWLNVMRNTLNAQIWGFGRPDFLCVSATHGTAHLALYDQDAWDKYTLAASAGTRITRNTFISAPPAAEHDPADFQSATGAFSPGGDSITVLQRRGVVFMACHNAIFELAQRLSAAGKNPDHLPVNGIAADLTNHLIPDVILTPGAVATLVPLQQAGFAYARSASP
jgi:hypothetical protein